MAEKDRIRTNKVSVWLLEEETAMLEKNSFELNLSKSEYLRKLILYGGMVGRQWSMDKEQGKKLLYELNRIGNNINQIAYNTNAKLFAANSDWEELHQLYLQLLELLGEFPFLEEGAREEWQQRISMLLPKP